MPQFSAALPLSGLLDRGEPEDGLQGDISTGGGVGGGGMGAVGVISELMNPRI